MSITEQGEPSKQLTIFTGTGELSFDEVLKTIRSFYGANPTLNVLCDLRQASAERISAAQVNQIAELIHKSKQIRKGGRTAIVSTRDVTYGVARMLEALINIPNDDSSYELRVFRDIKDAVRWLAGGQINKTR